MRQRVWLVLLLLYAAIGLADFSLRLIEDRRAEGYRINPANIPVAFAAALFWPADAVVRLLSR
jgi:hypothetical protein